MILRTLITSIIALPLATVTYTPAAQESPRIEIQMDATHIRSHQELPKLLYIVPWRDTDLVEKNSERKILIPDLFSDYYEPLIPDQASGSDTENRE